MIVAEVIGQMKVVTALVGGGRKHGVTHRATRQFLDDLQAYGDVRSELVFLSDRDVRPCCGCKACFLRGEEFCPLDDDRDALIAEMERSDGVILASPTYSFQVSGVMKGFLDRLGFALHRPRFHGRTCTSIVVDSIHGGRSVVRYLDFVGAALGFNVVKGSCVTSRKNPNSASEPMDPAELLAMNRTLAAHAARFHEQLLRPAFPSPSLLRLCAFRVARTSFRLELGAEYRDHVYYRDHGWFESDYYYPTSLGPLKRAAGRAVDLFAARASRRAGLR